MMGVREAALARARTPRKISGSRACAHDVVCGVLPLGGGENHKRAILAQAFGRILQGWMWARLVILSRSFLSSRIAIQTTFGVSGLCLAKTARLAASCPVENISSM